ncbi:MAG: aminoacyl-tRNA hydrolase [Verrucomicrobiaceae bacterium]|nr:aminoacyl-tRNA hydrolase [Verrucomicrobiaceae bacterium]
MKTPRLIVGLGNPGETYRDTRHNVGFMVLDELARRLGATFREEKRWSGLVAKFTGGYLLKPQTFMNDSGRSVQGLGHFHKTTPAETLVVYDDVDLPLGRLRFRSNGSAAGHNGIRSLISSLGTPEFPRLKVGIAPQDGRPGGDRMVGHVLGKFRPEEQPALQAVIQRAADAVLTALERGLDNAMNLFNRQPEPETPAPNAI